VNGGWYICLFVVGKSIGESDAIIFSIVDVVMQWCCSYNSGAVGVTR
jgi:hypothetical protein